MKTLFRFLLLSLFAIPFLGCDDAGIFNCTKGEGPVLTEDRLVTSFDRIEVRGDIDLMVTQDSNVSLQVEAEQSILDILETRVSSGILIIDIDRCIRSYKPIRVWVSNPDFKALRLEGSGDITSEGSIVETNLALDVVGSGDIELDITTDNLKSDIEGSGNIRLYGTAENHDIMIDGSGDVQALNMISENVEVNIEGSGDVWVNANSTLDVVIRGSGDVHYTGYPQISSIIEGNGNIIDEN